MSAHGHWWFNKVNARNKKDLSVYTHVPQPPPGRLDANAYEQRDQLNAPTTAGCARHPRTSSLWDTK